MLDADSAAKTLLTIFDAHNETLRLLGFLVQYEIGQTLLKQEVLRRNSVTSKMLTAFVVWRSVGVFVHCAHPF